ncbi:MAG TPA: hypothetical protein VMT47_17420 [Polyangia bacterium]|nr:hypothetical protein [Polyangia bacterium]
MATALDEAKHYGSEDSTKAVEAIDRLAAKMSDANKQLRRSIDELAQVRVTARTGRGAEFVFDWCEAIFPKMVADEEIGDAVELIDKWRRDPTCKHFRGKIVVKVVSTIVVLALNSIRFVVSSLGGKKAE